MPFKQSVKQQSNTCFTRKYRYNTPPMSKQKNAKANSGTIALNKKAKHDYFVEDRFEAGLALTGKSATRRQLCTAEK